MIDLPDAELRARLRTALGVRRWVDDVASRAPYDDLDALLKYAGAAATPLSPDEIVEAIRDHPRIGEQGSALSRAEQGSSTELADEIAAGNAAYEARFGRIFLIRAAGRTRAEILAELRRRLELDDATELIIVGEQLRDIALLRLQKLFEEAA